MGNGSDEGSGSRGRICPACGAELRTVVRQGVEIDRCPACRGVWLDRGELEKLVAIGTADAHARYEHPAGEDDLEPDPADKLATRRSFFAGLFEGE